MYSYIKFVLYSSFSFFLILIIKRKIYPSEIFFYESIFLLLIFSFFLILLQKVIFKKFLFKIEIFAGIITFFLLTYSILITAPALSKRSISLFILDYIEINSAKGGLTQNELEEGVTNEFLTKQDEISRRINEQSYSKNIIQKNGNFLITKRGKVINKINKFLIKIFNL